MGRDEINQTNIAIISGSADKTARIWKKNKSDKWVNSAILESHNGSINTLGVVRSRNIIVEKDLFATGSSDGVIKIWERCELDDTKDSVECIQTINLGSKYPIDLAISHLPESKVPILACGSTDKRLLLFVQKNGQFIESLSLQGHENWIRSLSFATYTTPISPQNLSSNDIKNEYKLQEGDLLLASGSQDKYIRIWKISLVKNDQEEVDKGKGNENGNKKKSLIKDLLANVLDDGTFSGNKVQLSTKAHIIDVEVAKDGESCVNKRYSIMFEALLMGHDDWIYSVCWQPPCLIKDSEGNLKYHQPMTILTSSSDKSMMIWKPEPDTGVWVNLTRVGEIGGYTLGFLGGLFNKKGNYIISHGHTGAFHLWKNIGQDDNDSEDWQPQVSISGHFNSVKDISWDRGFNYLTSVSLDQTARIFAPWCRNIDNDKLAVTWHEISRPQIHGYDINCFSFVNKWRYVSGSDEKVLRVFDAPKTFVQSLSKLLNNPGILEELESRPLGANLPALGLSNKAVFQADIKNFEEAAQEEEFLSRQSYSHSSATPNSLLQTLDKPPFEEHLLQHTLWPEIDKLYGHGFELISVGASNDGKYIASACKATIAEHAVIRLYDTSTWKELPNPLQSHTLTVTQIKFSHNDKYLLSVSRDRIWSIFEKCEGAIPYKFITKNKAHSRIIWDCSWSHDDKLFATGSRDKTVKIWTQIKSQEQTQWDCKSTIKFQEAVTAIDFAPIFINQRYLLAVGLENGKIFIYQSEDENQIEKWNEFIEVDKNECHVSSVNKLMWRNKNIQKFMNNENVKLQLASCGNDYCVRLLNLVI
ncbi:WD40 repeat-like protein [Rhizophagus irregularis]|uniref:Elongator complex protein 2 n=1 Tax=Rhizophagus irregularis TaxID=588596 RepID=A0A2N0Q0A6_9GLOM|nr:WD40 repeat-like protein [Rhizophagus irregularis]